LSIFRRWQRLTSAISIPRLFYFYTKIRTSVLICGILILTIHNWSAYKMEFNEILNDLEIDTKDIILDPADASDE
jgi:hypothetical protein